MCLLLTVHLYVIVQSTNQSAFPQNFICTLNNIELTSSSGADFRLFYYEQQKDTASHLYFTASIVH